jgi:hypothetical protein
VDSNGQFRWVANRRFNDLLAARPAEHPLPESVSAIVTSGFVESNGCLYLQALRDQDVDHDRADDRTGLEALVNHFHIDGDSETQRDFWTAVTAAEHLAEALSSEPEAGPTRVIVSRDEDGYVNSTVRFVRRRPGEAWLSDDLAGYAEPVGYLDVR